MKNDSSKQPKLVGTESHWVEITRSGGPNFSIREQVYFNFEAYWRGQDITVTMEADRYTHSSGLSNWRISFHRSNLTEAARNKLRPQMVPMVEAWLASDEYTASEQRAYAYAIRRGLYDCKPYPPATNEVRKMLESFRDKLSIEQRNHLLTAANAYDEFARLYDMGV